MVIIKKPHYHFYSESSIMGEWKPLISLVAHHNWMTSSNFSFPMALTRESLNITFCSAHFTKSCFKFQSIQDHAHLNHHAWREWNSWLVFFPFIFSIFFWNNLWFYLFYCVLLGNLITMQLGNIYMKTWFGKNTSYPSSWFLYIKL